MATPSFEKIGDYYRFRYIYYKNGKRHSVSKSGFKRKKDAENYAKKIIAEIDNGKDFNAGDMYLYDYAKKWKELYSDGTVGEGAEKMNNLILREIKEDFNLKLKDITKEEYQKYINKLAKRLSKASVKKRYGFINKVLREAVNERILVIDPTYKTVLKGNSKKELDEESKFLSRDEFDRLEKALLCGLDKEYTTRYMLLLAMFTGARIGEVMALDWKCVDFKNNKITINKSFNYAHTKTIKTTKTKNSVRTITVPKKIMDLLKDLKSDDEYVFKNVSHSAIRNALESACERAGIDRHIRIHSLRHTHASILLAEGVQPLVVSKRLGHSDPSITLKHYAHIIAELQVSEDDKINGIFS